MQEKQISKKEPTILGLIRQNLRQIFRFDNRKRDYLVYPEPDPDLIKVRSLFVRHLDCGSCNGCEMELTALSNPVYDIGRFGIRFEASPRHADVLAVTGPYTRNLDEAARLTIEAMPEPNIITIGDCASDGGVFKESYGTQDYPEKFTSNIIYHIPGCPPEPQEILNVLLTIECY